MEQEKDYENAVGRIEIDITYSVTFWSNGDAYKGVLDNFYDEDEARETYDKYLTRFDNVIMEENQLHKIIKLSSTGK